MSKIARIPVSSLPKGVPGLVRWIKVAHPAIYDNLARVVRAHTTPGGKLSGLGLTDPAATPITAADSGNPGIAQTIVNTVKDLVAVGLPLYQQQKLFDLQVKRAQQGLAPLDTARIADMSAVRVGVDSDTRKTGMLIAGGLAAALLGYAVLRGR